MGRVGRRGAGLAIGRLLDVLPTHAKPQHNERYVLDPQFPCAEDLALEAVDHDDEATHVEQEVEFLAGVERVLWGRILALRENREDETLLEGDDSLDDILELIVERPEDDQVSRLKVRIRIRIRVRGRVKVKVKGLAPVNGGSLCQRQRERVPGEGSVA